MYLWCSCCNKVNDSASWHVDMFKYGVCPSCGSSAYKNAVEWDMIYEVNGYESIPTLERVYSLSPTLDI